MSREIVEEIAQLVAEARRVISQAEALADKHGIEFDFDLAYGMGGTYIPEGQRDDYEDYRLDGGWAASSMSC